MAAKVTLLVGAAGQSGLGMKDSWSYAGWLWRRSPRCSPPFSDCSWPPRYSSLDAPHEALAWLVANGQADIGGQQFPAPSLDSGEPDE
jgi:hypothetical protein